MFYDNLKAICSERGTTVTAVLKDLGMSTGSTGKWKDGSIPKIDTVMQLSEYLNVSLDRLVYGERPESYSSEANFALDPEWAEIIERIPEERHQMCKDFLRTHMVIPEKYAQGKIG